MVDFPDEIPPEHAGVALFSRVFLHDGWSRILPVRAIEVLPWLDEPRTRDELDDILRARLTTDGLGLAATAWEPLTEWTQRALDRLGEEYGQEPTPVEHALAEDQQRHDAQVADMARYSEALGVAPVRTMGDLLTFMLAAGVVVVVDDAGVERLTINPAAPLPGEVLPLSDETREREDRIRWEGLHERTAQLIIRQFRPDDEDRLTVVTTSMQRLGRQLGVDIEGARAGLAVLLETGDFTASGEPETVAEHAVFEIRVDWALIRREADQPSVGPPRCE